ncbi:ABC transporter permease [Rhodococcus fascians]|nr:ABC transporter permease [Rhodococcus fascians]MBY4398985.1 ABC transporter permease [Rhodococcus fascians]MBY4408523.1 ABC transporter permease [Rhodococcus fascians]MBY4423562.1 ABC transporter permease [Rhodococcus fascians]MBY4462914.1 ABC transporter permease [Rhodococcus fascians]
MSTTDERTVKPEHETATSNILSQAWATTRLFRPVLILLVLLIVFMSVYQDNFLNQTNLINIATSMSVLWLVTLGATLVQISGGIDLSSGAVVALCGVFLATTLDQGVPGIVAILLTIVFGALVGAVANGLMVGYFGLNVFVVTLASMTALTGVVSLWSGTKAQFVQSDALNLIAIDQFFGLPMPIFIMIGALLVFSFVQNRTYFGRDVYAVGGSMTAAKLSGIRTARTHITVYAVAGGMAALAAVIAVGRIGASTPSPDNTLPLNAVAAILIGGTALAGGVGGVGGSMLGVLFIGVLQNGLSLSDVPTFWQQIITGVILLAAVLADQVQWRPRRRKTRIVNAE